MENVNIDDDLMIWFVVKIILKVIEVERKYLKCFLFLYT